MRKLASIRKIDDITPIKDADLIECVTIGGWNVVSKKGEFKKGDYCVYFEIDSFLPIEEKYEFLRKSSYKKWMDKEGFRLKSMKLRGVISQGLVMPIHLFNEISGKQYLEILNIKQKLTLENDISKKEQLEETYDKLIDVTELLKIEKYEPPIPVQLAGQIKGGFPNFIPKTDQERIQNLPEYFEKYKDVEFEESIKLDGTSMTVYFTTKNQYSDESNSGVCGRNWELKETKENTLWKLARQYKIIEQLEKEQLSLAIQGELIGENIQGNHDKIKGQDFKVYNVFNIETQKWLTPMERNNIIEKLNLSHVPILRTNVKIFEEQNMKDLLKHASGSSLNPNVMREGLVYKSNDGIISFKVISNEYLLKHESRNEQLIEENNNIINLMN